jgi:hypothetical protein
MASAAGTLIFTQQNLTIMNRTILIVLLAIVLPAIGFSQAYEGTIEYNKKKHAALVIEYPYPPDVVETAIVEKMEKLGYKGKEEKGLFNGDKGFRKFKNAYISEAHDRSNDYIIKVERRSKKQDDQSIVYMIMMNDDANVISALDASGMSKAKSFLNNLQPNVEASNLEFRIREQEDMIAKTEKKLRNLEGDKEDMEKKIKKLQEDIEQNVKDQETTQKDIEAQRKALEGLKMKRNPSSI